MSCLIETIRETKPECQTIIDEMSNADTLHSIIKFAWQLACILAVCLVEEILCSRSQAPTEWGHCKQCGRKLQSKGFAPRQFKCMIGVINWQRRLGRCPNRCKIGQVAPLDEALGLESNQRSDDGLRRIACLTAIFVPFETASMLLKELSQVEVSSQTIWKWVQDAGKKMRVHLETELDALLAGREPAVEAMSASIAAETLVIGSDGVMVPFRPEAQTPKGKIVWREVKVAILARLGKHTTRAGEPMNRVHHHRVAAVLGDVDDLSKRMWLEAIKQDIYQAPCVVWLSDGGRGFWRVFHERFSTVAMGVLDFYHATQNLWSGVKVWLDGRTNRAKTWFDKARHRLRHGQQDEVLADIQAALNSPDLPESAHKALTKLYNYLDKHREHIQYDKLKEAGLPIGSGLVESTCKWLIQQRFKGVGMRWSEDGFNHLLHLRLFWVNGRFDAFFPSTLASPKS